MSSHCYYCGSEPDEKWQLIETAPKSKSIILFAATDIADDGRVLNWKMASGYWNTGYEGDEKRSPWQWDGRQLYKYEIQPTHWISLPGAPSVTRPERQS